MLLKIPWNHDWWTVHMERACVFNMFTKSTKISCSDILWFLLLTVTCLIRTRSDLYFSIVITWPRKTCLKFTASRRWNCELFMYRSTWQTWRTRVWRNNGRFHCADVGTADQNWRQTDQGLHRGETRERRQKMDEVRYWLSYSCGPVLPTFTFRWQFSFLIMQPWRVFINYA